MQIASIDDGNDLYLVTGIIKEATLRDLHKIDLHSYKHHGAYMQEDSLRRELEFDSNDMLNQITTDINAQENRDAFSEVLEYKVQEIGTSFWWDTPGYTIGVHNDQEWIDRVLQIYLWPNDKNLGTVFYEDDEVRYAFDYIPNTGYLMNNKGQRHGMTVPVPADTIRLSVHCGL
mgnify:CR=1 FL=1|tara:strand:- start:59 stop:580 length:522 start_codon:yes stop_codon:yes gene_type:complete